MRRECDAIILLRSSPVPPLLHPSRSHPFPSFFPPHFPFFVPPSLSHLESNRDTASRSLPPSLPRRVASRCTESRCWGPTVTRAHTLPTRITTPHCSRPGPTTRHLCVVVGAHAPPIQRQRVSLLSLVKTTYSLVPGYVCTLSSPSPPMRPSHIFLFEFPFGLPESSPLPLLLLSSSNKLFYKCVFIYIYIYVYIYTYINIHV